MRRVHATGYDESTNSVQHGAVRLRSFGAALNVTRVGAIEKVGKTDPCLLLADMVTNALYEHLTSLPNDAALNAPSSVVGWVLAPFVYGVRDDALD